MATELKTKPESLLGCDELLELVADLQIELADLRRQLAERDALLEGLSMLHIRDSGLTMCRHRTDWVGPVRGVSDLENLGADTFKAYKKMTESFALSGSVSEDEGE
jgi:hypothetical protein